MANRESKGTLYHGTGLTKNAPPGAKGVASIPSKFETILFPGPRESKGFGSESRRFGDSDNDLPGPGRYTAPASTSALSFKPESSSKKGMGAMLSKDQRFKNHRVVYTGPGPGQYKPAVLPEKLDFNKAKASAAFQHKVPPVKPGLPSKAEEASPGPGSYASNEVTRTGQRLGWEENSSGFRSAFKGPGHDLKLMRDPDVPGPSSYQPGPNELWGESRVHSTAAARAPCKGGTSSFGGRSASLAFSNHVSAVPAVIFLEGEAAGGKGEAGPGPGSYETQAIGAIQTSLQRVTGRPSAAFQQSEFVDRFGRSLASPPQPTATDLLVQPQPRAQRMGSPRLDNARISSPPPGVGAPFKSTSPGHGAYDMDLAMRAPGPAFYSPSLPPSKKSFHLNARKKFGV